MGMGLGNVGTMRAFLTLDYSQYSQGLRASSGMTKTAMAANLATMNKYHSRLGMSATMLTAVIAPIAYGARQAEKLYGEYQKTLSKIEVVSRNTTGSMAILNQSLIKTGKELGMRPTELAEAGYEAAQAMYTSISDINDIVKAAGELSLASGWETTAKSASDQLTRVMQSFSLPVSSLSEVNDILLRTRDTGKFTMEELISSIGNVSAVYANAFPQNKMKSFKEMATLMASGTLGGLKPNTMAFGLRNIVMRTYKESQKSDSMLNALAKRKGHADANSMMRGGLIPMLRDIRDATGGFTEFVAALGYQQRDISAMSTLLRNGMKDTNQIADTIEKAKGSTAIGMKRHMQDWMYIKKVLVAFKDAFMLSFGQSIVKYLTKATISLTSFFQYLERVPEGTRDFIAMAVAITAVSSALGGVSALLGIVGLRMKALGVSSLASIVKIPNKARGLLYGVSGTPGTSRKVFSGSILPFGKSGKYREELRLARISRHGPPEPFYPFPVTQDRIIPKVHLKDKDFMKVRNNIGNRHISNAELLIIWASARAQAKADLKPFAGMFQGRAVPQIRKRSLEHLNTNTQQFRTARNLMPARASGWLAAGNAGVGAAAIGRQSALGNMGYVASLTMFGAWVRGIVKVPLTGVFATISAAATVVAMTFEFLGGVALSLWSSFDGFGVAMQSVFQGVIDMMPVAMRSMFEAFDLTSLHNVIVGPMVAFADIITYASVPLRILVDVISQVGATLLGLNLAIFASAKAMVAGYTSKDSYDEKTKVLTKGKKYGRFSWGGMQSAFSETFSPFKDFIKGIGNPIDDSYNAARDALDMHKKAWKFDIAPTPELRKWESKKPGATNSGVSYPDPAVVEPVDINKWVREFASALQYGSVEAYNARVPGYLDISKEQLALSRKSEKHLAEINQTLSNNEDAADSAIISPEDVIEPAML